ncbi:glucose transporter [Hamiltosporidium magnivora]|uniref:Glucose transporter n=1 Tax=Hamiltosporidium magnivora TaxID=148818 RepID=A0A4Q9LMT0_9MICR|nr:glucose transporter [Hamiltosporidium magnivora]
MKDSGSENKESINASLIYSTVLSCSGSWLFGLNMTSLDSLSEVFKNGSESIEDGLFKSHVKVTDSEWSIIVSIICIGALASNFLVNLIPLSRKNILILNNILYLSGFSMIFCVQNIFYLILGRFLIGMGAGVACAVVPLYLGEISPDKIRGLISSAHQFFIIFGVLGGQILSFLFSTVHTWRITISILIAISILSFIFLFFIQNPVMKNSAEENVSIAQLFAEKKARKSLFLSTIIHMGQQLTGINGVLFFSNEILAATGKARLYTISIGLVSLASTTVSMFTVDMFGRKLMLLLSCLVVSTGLSILGSGHVPVISLFIFISGFAIGLGPVAWFVTSEVYPSEYKSAGNAIAVSSNWMSSFFVALTFPFFYTWIGNFVFFIYATIIMTLFLFLLVMFKETKGKKADFQ